MRGTDARYQCEATGNLRGWNVRGATDTDAAGVVIGYQTFRGQTNSRTRQFADYYGQDDLRGQEVFYRYTALAMFLKGVLQRTFFISTNERLMYKFYKICNYFIFK